MLKFWGHTLQIHEAATSAFRALYSGKGPQRSLNRSLWSCERQDISTSPLIGGYLSVVKSSPEVFKRTLADTEMIDLGSLKPSHVYSS